MADDDNNVLDEIKKEAEEDIFTALGASGIPDEEKGALLGQMIEIAQTRTLAKLIETLGEEEKAELEKIAEDEEAGPEVLENFITQKVPEFPEIFTDEIKKLKQELIVKFSK